MLTSEYSLKFVAALMDIRHQHHHHQTAMMVKNIISKSYIFIGTIVYKIVLRYLDLKTQELDKLHH